MTWVDISEYEFRIALEINLSLIELNNFKYVTGPGRSGAISAVYASHILRVPYIPYKSKSVKIGSILIVDTVTHTGKTMEKAIKYYNDYNPKCICLFNEPPFLKFWYESDKPQRYSHEETK